MSDKPEGTVPISDLELVHWVEEKDSMRGHARAHGIPLSGSYVTFDDMRDAILEKGPIVIATPKADLAMFVLEGRFDNQIMVLRQSGINVRRFLVRETTFESMFGNFRGCVDHLLSNNTVEGELELQHLRDLVDAKGLDARNIDPNRDYSRLEVDLIAAMQLLSIKDKQFDSDADANFIFELGYSVGRLFSSAQNLATLEESALKARTYEESYKERGHKGRSAERKKERIEHLLAHLEDLVFENPALRRMSPAQVAGLALKDAETERPELWSQGKGQLENYLTELASDSEYRIRYNALFFKTG